MLQTAQLGTSREHGTDPCAEVLRDGPCTDGTGSAGMGRDGTGTVLALEHVLLHGGTEAKPQMLWLNLQPHPKVFFLNLINHESNLNSATFFS